MSMKKRKERPTTLASDVLASDVCPCGRTLTEYGKCPGCDLRPFFCTCATEPKK